LLALLHIFPFLLGLFSNMYFLAGSAVAWQYVHRIVWEEIIALRWTFLLIITILAYCHIQVVMETDMRWPDCPCSQSKSAAATENKKDD
jgi:hypothetical protein